MPHPKNAGSIPTTGGSVKCAVTTSENAENPQNQHDDTERECEYGAKFVEQVHRNYY